MKRAAAVISVLLHGAAGVAVARAHARPPPPTEIRVQMAVVEKAPLPTAAPQAPEPPREVRRTVRLARAPVGQAPAKPADAPPPPTAEAARLSAEEPVPVAGITFESTSSGGTFAVAVGNTLSAAPERVAREPAAARPYKAAHYAPASDLAELPRVLNQDAVDIRRYYPKDTLQRGFEGEVVLRLIIDADGSIAEAKLVKDPGEGLGAAALRAVREFRFAPGTAGGAAVATAIPFVIRFVIS